jgi:hypothetical protein
MTELKPTPARLALLRAVERGEVKRFRGWGHEPDSSEWIPPEAPRRRVTSAVDLMFSAGWVRLGPRSSPSYYSAAPWLLTDAGRAVLAAHPEKETTDG